MEVFVDLEETLVQSWDNPILCNVQKLTTWFKNNNVTQVHLFSFAVWNDRHRDVFVKDFQPFLENAFGVKFVTVPTAEEMMKVDTKVTGCKFEDITEFIAIRCKVGAFQSWCRLHPTGDCCILIDDVVPNLTMNFEDDKLLLKFINVLKMK